MTECIRIFDKRFFEIGVCGAFLSLAYTEEFREAGWAVLTLPDASPAAGLLEPDGYISPPNAGYFIIESVTHDKKSGTVKAKCKGLLSLLSRTVSAQETTYYGAVGALLRSTVRQCADNLPAALGVSGAELGDTVSLDAGRRAVYDDMVSLCRLGGVGMTLAYDKKQSRLVFSVLTARDRTRAGADPVSVSESLGTLSSESFVADFSGYRNVAVVSGAEREEGGRYTLTVRADEMGFRDGFYDRDFADRQTLVTFSRPRSDFMSGELFNETAYMSAMRAAGASVLARCRPKFYLHGRSEHDASRISPGDIVALDEDSGNFGGRALVERITTSYRDGGRTVMCELCAAAE